MKCKVRVDVTLYHAYAGIQMWQKYSYKAYATLELEGGG
jgi:hypothetical protein